MVQKQLSVNFDALESTVQNLSDAASEIAATLAALDAASTRLRNGWTGQASDAFDEAKRAWEKDLHELNAILVDATKALGDAQQRYAKAEAHNVALWPV